MAVETFKTLAQAFAAAAVGTIYTAPAAGGGGAVVGAVIRQIRVVNTDHNASHSFILYQNGAGAVNQITGRMTLGPDETYMDAGPHSLNAGETIRAVADVAAVMAVTVSGVETTP